MGSPSRAGPAEWNLDSVGRAAPTVCLVGSGWLFTSGISYYTCRLANAFAEHATTSTVLMRRLLPRRLYPGASRVGARLNALEYSSKVSVFDGVDWFWGRTLPRAVRFLVHQKPDVMIFQWWSGTVLHSYLMLALIARFLRSQIVIEFHEVLDTAEASIPLVGGYVRLALRPLLRWSAGFAVHSEHDRSLLARTYDLRGKPVVVVPHGPYGPAAAGAAEPSRRSGDEPIQLLFFGTIRPYKGLEFLLRAFNALDDETAGRLALRVIGETWEGWTLPAELIARSPHRSRIDFVNRYVTDEEADEAFRRADVVVLPYLRSSASGPLHQAMGYGLPVVVSRVGGLTEVASAYAGATLVPPADVEALRIALIDIAGRSNFERHVPPTSWDHSVRTLLRLTSPEAPSTPTRKAEP